MGKNTADVMKRFANYSVTMGKKPNKKHVKKTANVMKRFADRSANLHNNTLKYFGVK